MPIPKGSGGEGDISGVFNLFYMNESDSYIESFF